jgi:hypothetical protein
MTVRLMVNPIFAMSRPTPLPFLAQTTYRKSVMGKLPAFLFYPADWLTEPNLRRCSHAAKGVWIDLLCIMFQSETRGVLCSGDQPWGDEDIAAAVGGDTVEVLAHLNELLSKGVAHRREDGAVYSRRMVRDEQERIDAKQRKRKERETDVTPMSQKSHADVTPMSQRSSVSVTSSTSEEDKSSSSEREAHAKGGKYSSLRSIDPAVIEMIAKKHEQSVDFVDRCWDRAKNWLKANGKTKKDYRAFLDNWVEREVAQARLRNADSRSRMVVIQ